MYAGYGYAHATYVHYEAAVTVDADDIAFETGKEAGGDAQLDVARGIVFERMEQETYAFRRGFQHAHERLHHAVGDNGRAVGAAIVDEVVAGGCGVQVLLKSPRKSLQEHKAADGRFFYGLDASGVFPSLVYDGFMDEIPYAIVFKLMCEHGDFGMVNEEITP